jgi:hypothetical protein
MVKRRLSNDFNIYEILRYYHIKPTIFFNVLQHLKVNKEIFIGNEKENTITISKNDIDSIKRCLDLIKTYYINIDYVYCPIDEKLFYIYAISSEVI